jgi:hypothetical protein
VKLIRFERNLKVEKNLSEKAIWTEPLIIEVTTVGNAAAGGSGGKL